MLVFPPQTTIEVFHSCTFEKGTFVFYFNCYDHRSARWTSLLEQILKSIDQLLDLFLFQIKHWSRRHVNKSLECGCSLPAEGLFIKFEHPFFMLYFLLRTSIFFVFCNFTLRTRLLIPLYLCFISVPFSICAQILGAIIYSSFPLNFSIVTP